MSLTDTTHRKKELDILFLWFRDHKCCGWAWVSPTTMTEETEPIYVEVPLETKQLAKERLEHGGITRVCRERLEEIAHGKETSEKRRVKDQLQDLRDRRRDLKSERDQIESELDDVEIKIERAEQRLDEIQDREGEYEGALAMLEERLQEGEHLFKGHGQVKEAAERGGCTQEDVLEDLKERNPNLSDDQFEPMQRNGNTTNGVV